MSRVYDSMIEQLESAREAATLETASFGFPNERIEIKAVHFKSAGGEVGEKVHPTDYCRRMVQLHHATWIISPLDAVISVLKEHRELIERAEKLREALNAAGLEELAHASRGGKGGTA